MARWQSLQHSGTVPLPHSWCPQNLRQAEDAAEGDEYKLKKTLEQHAELSILAKASLAHYPL